MKLTELLQKPTPPSLLAVIRVIVLFFFFFCLFYFFLLVVLVRIPAVEESIVCSWPSPSLWPLVSSERSGALKERRGLTASCPHSEDTTVSVVVATQADC